MGQFFRKFFAYFTASANAKFDEKADPLIQLEQATTEAKKRHENLTTQAAKIIGNELRLVEELKRKDKERNRVEAATRQALIMVDEAIAKGDEVRAAEIEKSALAFSEELTALDSSLEDTQADYEKAKLSSQAAKDAVENSGYKIKELLSEAKRLGSKVASTRLQEEINAANKAMSDLSVSGKEPSLAEIREKIETRHAQAMGEDQLHNSSVNVQMAAIQREALKTTSRERLDQLRESMGVKAPASVQKEKEVAATKASEKSIRDEILKATDDDLAKETSLEKK